MPTIESQQMPFGRVLDSKRSLVRSKPETGLSWIRRGVFLAAAGFFFALGFAGVILPGLPATPFFLLTSFFLAKSSPKLNRALHRMAIVGPILRDWSNHRGVRTAVKIQALFVVVLALSLTLLFASVGVVAKLSIAALGVVGIAVILYVPTISDSNE